MKHTDEEIAENNRRLEMMLVPDWNFFPVGAWWPEYRPRKRKAKRRAITEK